MNDRNVHCAWEEFVESGIGSARVRNTVLNSWQRSRQHRVCVDLQVTQTLNESELHRKRQQGSHLLNASRQALEQARHLLASSDLMMMLTDADGIVLDTAGDTQTVARGQDIGLQRGGIWDETVIGTNAIGTALVTGAPVQIHASEHFCSSVQRWTCAAAPIRHPQSHQVVGIVDLSGKQHTFSPQNLAHVVALAQQVESALLHDIDAENADILRHFLTRRGHWHHDGLLAVGHGGRIIHATEAALNRLQQKDQYLIDDGCITALGVHDPANWPTALHAILPEADLDPVLQHGRHIGALIVLPQRVRHDYTKPLPSPSPTTVASTVITHPRSHSPIFRTIIGESACMRQICATAEQMSISGAPILIEGETGVGKELFARAIHAHSAAKGAFIPVNCGGMPRELIGSELFGYARGAFTGADRHGKPGKIEAAAEGTLCLDEIGEMPLDLQPWLLRVLEDGIIYRIGSHQPHPVKLRLVSVTNRDLAQACTNGHFRNDLFYRIAVLRLHIPPLRERGDDVILLAEHLALKASERTEKTRPRFSQAALDLLRRHSWPGNVRELRNVVEMLVFLSSAGQEVNIDHVSQALSRHSIPAMGSTPPTSNPQPGIPQQDLRQLQREAMLAALRASQGNVSRAARALGIARSTLYARLSEWNLHPAAVLGGQVR